MFKHTSVTQIALDIKMAFYDARGRRRDRDVCINRLPDET